MAISWHVRFAPWLVQELAVEHRDVIRKFGRFPYRNAALGRHTTGAEQSYLQEHGFAA